MKYSLFIFLALMALVPQFLFAKAIPKSTEPPFIFQYMEDTLVYSMNMEIETSSDVESGGATQHIEMAYSLHYDFKLTQTEESNAQWHRLRLEPSNIQGHWDVKGPGGHIVVTLDSNAQMKGTQDETLLFDTENGIGVDQAQEFKKEIYPLYLSGSMELDSLGNLGKFYGDLPFEEFWNEATLGQIGMFGIVFPEKSVAVGQKWQKSLTMKKMSPIELDGKGVKVPIIFTRIADSLEAEKRLNVFDISSSFKYKNLSGTMAQSGMTFKVKIPQMDRIGSGRILFDKTRGVLIHAESNNNIIARMSLALEGETATLTMHATNVSSIDLVK